MDGVGRAVGAGTTIRLPVLDFATFRSTKGGEVSCDVKKDPQGEVIYQTYSIKPLVVYDYGLIEQKILSEWATPGSYKLAELMEGMTPLQQELTIKLAMDDLKKKRTVRNTELAAWSETVQGVIYTFWLGLKKSHPEFDCIEKAIALFQLMSGEEKIDAKHQVDVASGADAMGNSTGQT